MNNKSAHPFVCNNRPFVCIEKPLFEPSVIKILPSVRFSKFSGFTLIELMVVVVITAILLTLAFPALRQFILSNRIATQTNELISDINISRSEAIKRGTNVVLCTSSTGINCDGTGWTSGRLIFADTNLNSVVDAGEDVIRFHEPLSANLQVGSTTTYPDPLIYNNRGRPVVNGTFKPLPGAVNFVLCDADMRVEGRTLTMGVGGQTYTGPVPIGTCP